MTALRRGILRAPAGGPSFGGILAPGVGCAWSSLLHERCARRQPARDGRPVTPDRR